MEMTELIEKINYYAALAKTRELSAEEKNERQVLREKYIEIFKQNFKSQLDNIEVVDEESDSKVS